jgi:outer membrane protein insertion porin family
MCCLIALFFALAHAQPSGNLIEVRIEGVSETFRENLIRTTLSARVGTPVERVDLEAERNRILGIGTFSEVSLSIEDRGRGPILFVRVRENPPIAEIEIVGTQLEREPLKNALNQANLLAPGTVYNTLRAQEGIRTLQDIYRQAVGFPFEVPVTLDVLPTTVDGEEAVTLRYTVTENVPLSEVVFEGSSVLSDEELSRIFAPLERADAFNFLQYQEAVTAVAEAYRERGFRQSGVDQARTELIDGSLQVRFRELRIVGIDATAVGIAPGELSLGVGDLYNYDVLLEDVRRLAAGRSSDIRIEELVTGAGDVRVRFVVGPPDSAGPVEGIEIEGNTVFSDEELEGLLILREGDTFTSELAREDFRRIRERYAREGYFIVDRPDFNYLDGTYLQRIQEVRIAGYDIVFEDEEARTEETVITRYLPPVGSVYNQPQVRRNLREVARLGVVELRGEGPTIPDPSQPDQAIVTLVVREAQTRTFSPSLEYATDTGLQASLSYSDTNFQGQAHNVGAEVTALTSDLGFQLGISLSYSIPWLYLDFLDFQEVPTSVSASIFSVVSTNQPLFDRQGSTRIGYPGLPATEENRVFIGEYTERNTGVSFTVGRPIFENTTARVSVRLGLNGYFLEPPRRPCEVEDGEVVNRNCELPEEFDELRESFLPQSGASGFVSSTVVYDNRDSFEFPREGLSASARVGFGFGTDFRNPETNEQQGYSYQQLEVGFKTYLLLRDLAPAIDDPNHVFAFKLNAGHQFGGLYPTSRYFIVGDTPNEATQIRGYRRDDILPSRTYLTGSIEYRYDFGFDTIATETVIGILFVDVGYASSVPGFEDYRTPLLAGVGAGLQLNLGFGGFALPPLRLDYGFSQRNPAGKLSFRLGPVF